MISVHIQGNLFNITVIQVYTPTTKAEETEAEWLYEDLQDLLELTPKKYVIFIIGNWNAKVGSQETPGVARKFGLEVQYEVGQSLTEFCRENTLVIANTLFQQHKRRLYTGTSPDGQYQNRPIIFFAAKMEKTYTVNQNKTWSWLSLRSSASYCKIQAQIEEYRENH